MNLFYLTLEAPREGQASYVHVHEIIDGLEQQGVNVTLYEPSYTSKKSSPGLLGRLFESFRLQAKLWLQWKKGTILYVRGHYLAYPSAIITRLFNIPIYHEINGPYEDVFVTHPSLNKFRSLLIPMQRIQYKMATGLIAVTKELQTWANKEAKRSDCTFISNGANTKLFKPDIPKPTDAPDDYVVFFGGLTRWHGVPIMLDAIKEETWPENVKLLILGDGQETDKVLAAAQNNDRLIYLGRRPYKEIPPYIANAKAGLVTISNPDSRSQTGVLPLKLYETMACGIPPIVTDLPGQADLVRQYDCGIVIAQDNPAELAQAVRHVFDQMAETRNMGQRAHEAVEKEHSWFRRSEETLSFIKSKIEN